MAMTGGVAIALGSAWKANDNYTTMRLYGYYKLSQNVSTGESTLTLGLYVNVSKGEIGNYVLSGSNEIGIAGGTAFTSSTRVSGSGVKWLVQEKVVTIQHDAQGNASFQIRGRWAGSSSWAGVPKTQTSTVIPLPALPSGGQLISVTGSNVEGIFSALVAHKTGVDVLRVYLDSVLVKTINNYNGLVFTFSDDELLTIYNNLENWETDLVFELKTYVDSTLDKQIGEASSITKLVTADGNAFRNINGVWKKGLFYKRINGVWRPQIKYKKISGNWKKGE